MDMPEGSPFRKGVMTIQKSGEKAAAIVQDLLTLARRGVSTKEIVDLNHIVSDYLKSPEHEKLKLYHPGIRVETHLEEGLLSISGSPVHLSKTVMNLVSNAAEATDQGVGKISLSTGRRYLDSPIKGYGDVRHGEYVSLSVSDNGIGISPEEMERVFEPFYTKKVMGRSGTGLGMTVVWGTVKDHNGYIEVQSIEGSGTTFTLYFPVATTRIAEKEPTVSIKDFRGKGESVLVVDDVEEQRIIATGMLKKLGYAATSVSCGEDAIEHVKHNDCDLLILDMIMDHGMDGLETYKRVLELHPGQKAIIASGFSATYRVTETQRLGAGEYIKKPYTLERIGLAVRKELQREISHASKA
jgi:two-component system cell cycle sensor histidine kinase/response regulator CckA